MKTEKEVRSRLKELNEKLTTARHDLANNPTEEMLLMGARAPSTPETNAIRRLEGNIGALEWVLRGE